jgi:hypothetical protein
MSCEQCTANTMARQSLPIPALCSNHCPSQLSPLSSPRALPIRRPAVGRTGPAAEQTHCGVRQRWRRADQRSPAARHWRSCGTRARSRAWPCLNAASQCDGAALVHTSAAHRGPRADSTIAPTAHHDPARTAHHDPTRAAILTPYTPSPADRACRAATAPRTLAPSSRPSPPDQPLRRAARAPESLGSSRAARCTGLRARS